MTIEPPETDFERYLADVERTHPLRQRYQPGPFRWWHPLPGIVVIGGAFALAAWKIGQAWRVW